jgi:benzylsuccinate CoA-transferase BbsE subunit
MKSEIKSKLPGPLSSFKVLDLAGPIGVYATKLMADLGAEVIRVEPPSGDPMRLLGPFYQGKPGPNNSLYWWQFNTNKKSITLDLQNPKGRDLFMRLAQTVDVVVETFSPGHMDSLGLGFENLHRLNQSLVMTSVTPFGQTGPKKSWKASDLVGQAEGGIMNQTGFKERAPYRIGFEMGYWTAGVMAANATMMALYYRDLTDLGQHLDVSMQSSIALSLNATMSQWYTIEHIVARRGHQALLQAYSPLPAVRSVFPCKDGWVYFILASPGTSIHSVNAMLKQYGFGDLWDERWLDVSVAREEREEVEAVLAQFFANYTRRQLMEMGFSGDFSPPVFAVPTNTAEDIANDPHLQARDWFQNVNHPELGEHFLYPGPPYRMPASPWHIQRRAPLVGEDNLTVYHETLGLQNADIEELRRRGVV